MSLLRIYASQFELPLHCQWTLTSTGHAMLSGEGPLAQLPRRAERVQLVLPAAQVLILRARLPLAARRHTGSVLAFALEEQITGEPDSNQVSWLGMAGADTMLAVVDKSGLARWRTALDAIGIGRYEVHCESLLLPWEPGQWSLAWNGNAGFVKTGQLEAVATDCGDRKLPPLCLRLMLEAAQANHSLPSAIVLYETQADAAPDIAAWTRELGIAMRLAGRWDWRTAPPNSGVSLSQERQRWQAFNGMTARLRPAAWLLAAALAIHAIALIIDWSSLTNQQQGLRQQMEARFRAVFPNAVAVADPALQMRRQLAQARHAAGLPDSGDFLPMIAQVAVATKELPVGTVRTMSYEGGRLTLEFSSLDTASLQRIVGRLRQSGLSVDSLPDTPRSTATSIILTVRAL